MPLDLEEQEQLDQLKAFWQKYRNLITGILTAVLFAYAAYSGYGWWRNSQALEASKLYETMVSAIAKGDQAQSLRAADDLQKDFAPVALIGTIPHLIVVNPTVPAKNLPELIAFIKSKKGDFNYASQGNGSLSHLESTLFMQRIGATGTHIPYKGSSFALPDLIAGNTLMMFDSVTASLPHIQSGKLRPIAIAAAERSPLMPNVPTLGQDGMKQFDVENFYAVYVPKGTSPAIIAKLEREIRKILTNPDFKARMAAQGIHPQFANSEKLAEITAEEASKWTKVVKSANIKVD